MNDEANVLSADGQPEVEVAEVETEGPDGGEQEGDDKENLPEVIKKRLGQQQKKHKREIRELRDQLDAVTQHMMSMGNQQAQGGMQEQQQQPQQQQRQMDPRHAEEMQKHYAEFNRELEKAAEKYDDFDEVVRDKYAPFTDSIREIASTLDNPGDVIYSLGKNRDELYRIKDLPPHRQAKELNKLSKALSLKEKTVPQKVQPKVMGQLKANGSVIKNPNQATSVSDFRKMLRSGRK